MRWAHVVANFEPPGNYVDESFDDRWSPAAAFGVLRWAVKRGLIEQPPEGMKDDGNRSE